MTTFDKESFLHRNLNFTAVRKASNDTKCKINLYTQYVSRTVASIEPHCQRIRFQ